MLNFENTKFRGGYSVKQEIWDGLQPIIEEWVGKKCIPVSLYGIRIYHDGQVSLEILLLLMY